MSDKKREELKKKADVWRDELNSACAAIEAAKRENCVITPWMTRAEAEARFNFHAALAELGTLTTTPKRARNEAARCGNCPYCILEVDYPQQKDCCALNPNGVDVFRSQWCGQHPDFWCEAMTALVNPWKARVVELLAAVLPLAEYMQETFGDVTETHPNALDTEVKLPLNRIMPIFDACTRVANAMGDGADADKG